MERDYQGYFAELARSDPEPLTPSERELDCLRYTSHGLTAQECSEAMHYGVTSVEDALARARRDLGAKTTTHAVAIALRLGLID
jgi:DNA-binding CsgD family transcriptional regulator